MKISYLSHATLLIEVDGIKILSDPWVVGASYCDQWYLFPKPADNAVELLKDVDYVVFSHGHEDHLHYETLQHVNKSATVFFPYTWYEGAVPFFKELGFSKVTEAVNEKRYKLSKELHITFLANNLDNVIVLESRDKVLVNVNDALPSAPQGIITHFIKKINSKWGKVDYLFSSYGSASYFPNTIKCDWKNDEDVGHTREQFFLDNFCKIAKGINATYSIPFASDFVLLDDSQRWINKLKVQRSEIQHYYAKHYSDKNSSTKIIELYAGDTIDDNGFLFTSAYHEKFKHNSIASLAEIEYNEEIIKRRSIKNINAETLEMVCREVKKHVHKKAYIIPQPKRNKLKFTIQLTDSEKPVYIEIDLRNELPAVELRNEFTEDNLLLMKIKSQTLLHSIGNEWGGDAIIIGYGCELTVFSKETIIDQLENYAIQLLTNYPNTKEYIKKYPFRTLKYLLNDKVKRSIFLNKIRGKKTSYSPFVDERLVDNQLWLTRTNCEICKKCNLPLLTEKLAATIN